ncbi:MAG: T9SS type A sorting domain-containing protein, partial [Bacteroidota bacterium]
QWGAANQPRVDQAVTAGRWDDANNFVSGNAPYHYNGGANDVGSAFWDASFSVVRLLQVDPSSESVTLKNFGTASQDISAYQFCLGPGQYNILSNYGTLSGDLNLDPDEELIIDLTSGTLGVTALPDANGGLGLFSINSFGSTDPDILKDYVQWGAANQPRVDQAVTAGRWDDANNFVAGGAPYNYIGGANNVGPNWWIDDTAIRFTEITPETDILVIRNFDNVTRDLTDYYLCTLAGVYPQLGNPAEVEVVSGDLTLDPDEEVRLRVLTTGGIVDGSGTLFLFSTNLLGFNNQNAFVTRDFAQWGSANGFRTDNAVAIGIWDDAANFIDGPSPYTFIGSATDFGSPFWEAARAIIRLFQVDPDSESVTLKNFGNATQDVSDYQFCLGPGQYNILSDYGNLSSDLLIDPDEELIIDIASGTLGVTALPDANGGLGLFSTNSFQSTDPAILLDYVQWGAANQARVDQAVTAGRWDDANNFIVGAAPFNYIGDAADVGVNFWDPTIINLVVELSNFRGRVLEQEVWLEWTVLSEIDNRGFAIERSANGLDWEEIQFIRSLGNTLDPRSYNAIDKDPLDGVNYYRLRTEDLDGSIDLSDVIILEIERVELSVAIFPNPTSGPINVQLENEGQNVRIQVFSSTGQRVYETAGTVNSIDVSNLPRGTYFLVVQSADQLIRKSFVVQ